MKRGGRLSRWAARPSAWSAEAKQAATRARAASASSRPRDSSTMVRFMPLHRERGEAGEGCGELGDLGVERVGGDEVVEEAEGGERVGVEALGEQEQAAGGLAPRRSMARAMPAGS